MIKKLRNKFVIVTMLLLTIVFTLIFGTYYSYSAYWNRVCMIELLEWIAESDSFQETIEESGVGNSDMKPIIAVDADKEGNVVDISSSHGHPGYEKVQEVTDGILSVSEGRNKWRAYLFYKDVNEDGSYYIVYTDYSMSEYDIRQLVGFISLPIAALAGIFGISIFLSRFVTRPAEEMLAREKRFISDASHELKTPVAAIRVNAQVLATQEEDNRLVKNILSETERMSSLINELLTFSYLEERGQEFLREKFSLSDSCEEIALALESTAFEKRINFEYEIQRNINYVGNNAQIKRMISVLLENAVQHTPEGGDIAMKAYVESWHPVITVYNTGDGIPKEDIPHIFDRFYRRENERGGKNGNFGLGLSIAKTIAENHHGTIEVRSVLGKNAEFEVRL